MDHLIASLPSGFRVHSPLSAEQRSHIVCLQAATPEKTAEVFKRLREKKIWLSLRGDRLRVAPHVYNSTDDVNRLIDGLKG